MPPATRRAPRSACRAGRAARRRAAPCPSRPPRRATRGRPGCRTTPRGRRSPSPRPRRPPGRPRTWCGVAAGGVDHRRARRAGCRGRRSGRAPGRGVREREDAGRRLGGARRRHVLTARSAAPASDSSSTAPSGATAAGSTHCGDVAETGDARPLRRDDDRRGGVETRQLVGERRVVPGDEDRGDDPLGQRPGDADRDGVLGDVGRHDDRDRRGREERAARREGERGGVLLGEGDDALGRRGARAVGLDGRCRGARGGVRVPARARGERGRQGERGGERDRTTAGAAPARAGTGTRGGGGRSGRVVVAGGGQGHEGHRSMVRQRSPASRPLAGFSR